MGQLLQQNMGDTTLTKVFVGGLAWETQKEALREHFDQYGDILEAVIISDKLTGRSKGYGFVTFKEAEAAKKACEEATPVINGRRANCNLASLGARRQRPSPPATPPLPNTLKPAGMGVAVSRGVSSGPPAPWYYHPSGTPPPPPSPYHHHHYPGVLPFYPAAAYGYSPSYMTDLAYSAPAKLSHHHHHHPQGQFSYPNTAMLPVYPPMYHFHHQHQQSHSMGVPAHFYPPSTATAVTTMPTIISKPVAMAPAATVEQVTGC